MKQFVKTDFKKKKKYYFLHGLMLAANVLFQYNRYHIKVDHCLELLIDTFVFGTDITSAFAGAAFKLFRYHCCYCILICTRGLYACKFLCNPTKALQSHNTGNLMLQACKMNNVKTILQRPVTVMDFVFNVAELKNCILLATIMGDHLFTNWNQDR